MTYPNDIEVILNKGKLKTALTYLGNLTGASPLANFQENVSCLINTDLGNFRKQANGLKTFRKGPRCYLTFRGLSSQESIR